jgi:hypothetical protein
VAGGIEGWDAAQRTLAGLCASAAILLSVAVGRKIGAARRNLAVESPFLRLIRTPSVAGTLCLTAMPNPVWHDVGFAKPEKELTQKK